MKPGDRLYTEAEVQVLREQYQALHDRVDEELRSLERWAGEQNAGNAFAEQVRWWALSRLEKLERGSNSAKVEGPETYAEAVSDSSPASRQDSA